VKKLGHLKIKSSSEIKESRIGIGFECLDRDLFDPEKCYDLFARTGAKFARCQTGWAKTEKVKGVYDWTWLDSIIDNLIARSITPWFNVGYGNPIYMPDANNPTAVGFPPTNYGDEVVTAWLDFVKALAGHFKGRVTHFEIWNEPDDPNFWQPTYPSGAEYGKLVKITGDAIRSVLPEAKIGACSARSKNEFIKPLFEAAGPDGLDFFCSHNYDSLIEFGEKSATYGNTHELLKHYGMKKTEHWMGECGHASHHPVGHWLYALGGGSEHRQAVWYLRRALCDFRCNLRLTSFYIIADPWENAYVTATTNEAKHPAYGVLNGLTYTLKLAHTALSCLANLLGGDTLPKLSKLPVTLSAPITSEQPCPMSVAFTHDDNEVFAYWIPYAIEEERGITGRCSVTFDEASEIKDPIIIDLLNGTVFSPDMGEWDIDTKTLKHLPIGEYPFAICDKSAFETI
jgi:hypothetical protein